MKTATMYQHLRAENSPTGNPQRCFVMLAEDGGIVNIIDEGYRGLPKECKGLIELHSVNISKSDDHSYIRLGNEKREVA